VHSIHSHSSSTLGFLRRNIWCCPAQLKETAYVTLVRATLEYVASIWDPHLAKNCDILEKLQRHSARFVKGTTSSVTQMLHDLGWRDLKDRPRDLRLALLYKIVTGHVVVSPDQIVLVAADNRTRVNHRYKFRAIGHLHPGCTTHLLSEQLVSGTSSLLLLLSRRLQLPSKLSWPDWRMSHAITHFHHCWRTWSDTPRGGLPSTLQDKRLRPRPDHL